MKKIIPINTTADGLAFAIRAKYYGTNLKMLTSGGGFYPSTGVMEVTQEQPQKNAQKTHKSIRRKPDSE